MTEIHIFPVSEDYDARQPAIAHERAVGGVTPLPLMLTADMEEFVQFTSGGFRDA